MQLFYATDAVAGRFELSPEESRHVRVLRKKPGDRLHVTNGQGRLFFAEIITAGKESFVLETINVTFFERSRPNIVLAIAPTKHQDRLEWCIEKCTEIGLSEIYLLQCRYSEKLHVKEDRLRRTILEAMKQSNQHWLPQIHSVCTFTSFLETAAIRTGSWQKLIAWCGDGDKLTALSVEPLHDTLVLIGPEGDFSLEEVNLAQKAGFKPISLGANRLRTETAAVYAVTMLQILQNKTQ
jgi:16S rRNA (uracil1498-N3)-methyltransferase